MSTIKVDTIATRTGSGNITLGNNVASLTSSGAISGTTITATASGAPLTVNSTNSNNNKIIFQDNGSAVSHLGGISNGLVFANAAGTQLGRLDAEGLKFGTDTASENGLNDYEKGTWTVGVSKNTAFTSPTSSHAYYIRVGDLAFLSFYWYKVGISSSGSDQWTITGIPFNMRAGSAGGYQHGHVGYIYIGSDRSGNGNHRWQANAATELVLYGQNLNTNVNGQNVEFSGSITCRLA